VPATTDYNSSAYTISSTDELSFEESILDESPLSLLEKNSKQRQQLLRGETYRGSGKKGLPLEVQRKRLLAATQGASSSVKRGGGNEHSVGGSVSSSKSNMKESTKGSASISGKSYQSQIKQKQRQANVPTTIEELSIDSYSIGQAEEEEEKWTSSDDKWLESESSDDKLLEESDDDFSVSIDEEISILSQMEQRRSTNNMSSNSEKKNSKSKNMNSKSEKKKSWLGSWGSSEKKKVKDTYSMESSSISSSRGGGTTISSSKESMASRSSASQSAASRSNTSHSSRSYQSGPSTISPQSEEASHHHLHSIQEDDENELPPSSSVSSQYQTNISNLVSSSMMGSSTSTGGKQNDKESTSKTKRGKSIFSKLLGGKSSNTVASRLGYQPPLEKQRVDTLLNNEFPQENNLHNISTPGGERSNSSSTSSCVKRARELLVDIESRGPSQYDDDDSSYNTNNNGKRRLCNSINNNKILNKKGCIISSTLLLLIFGVVGTLTSLNVIMLPSSLDWRAFSLGNNNNNSSTVNEDTNNEGGGEVVSTEVWYVNWDIYKCVKDCIGPLPCGGERTDHLEVDFASLESCCRHGFEVYISNDWSVEECIEVSSYGIEPNNDEDEEDTDIPTFSPVMQGEVKTRRPNNQPTVVQGSRTPPSSPNDGQFKVPVVEEKEMYYANWDTNKCTLQSSLTKKPWDIGYETEEECCIPNFGWISDSDCYTDASSGVVAPSPSAVDTSPGDNSDDPVEYYADFVQGKCLPKSSTATRSRFQHTFATYDKCCHDNFRWNTDSDCYTDVNYTVDVTTVIDKRDDTLPPAAAPPSTETEDTSEESTAVDLSDIIGTASPSVTPTSSNQKYYADVTTRTCILKHVSTMARWDVGYESHDTCCEKNFSYDPTSVCYVGEQDAVTTTISATSAASEEIDEEGSSVEMLYFAHFDQGKCIEDTAEQGAKWGLGYSTQDECCHAYFKYSRDSSCYDGSAGTLSPSQTDNGDRIIDNGEVTLAPNDSPSYLPTSDFPTLGKCILSPFSWLTFLFTHLYRFHNFSCNETVPSKSPSIKPTLRPSNSPIVLGTPTESPVASPSSSPTMSSMPTSHPTQKPTHKPSVSPTVGSTNAPSASPLDQLEVLSAELMIISPESTEDLNESSSSQYRAMKW